LDIRVRVHLIFNVSTNDFSDEFEENCRFDSFYERFNYGVIQWGLKNVMFIRIKRIDFLKIDL